MPSKARPAAAGAKATESIDEPPADAAASEAGDAPAGDGPAPNAETADATGDADGIEVSTADSQQAESPQPGVYRFTWPYSCVYNLPGQTSKAVKPEEEVFWPAGPPDALWEFVTTDEPAPAPSDNTPRE